MPNKMFCSYYPGSERLFQAPRSKSFLPSSWASSNWGKKGTPPPWYNPCLALSFAGWALNPSASNDPTKNPKYTISHNYVENKSTRQGIGIFALSDGAVIEKNEVVVTGNSTNPGSSGLPLNRGLSIVSDNCYVGQNRIAGEGEYAMWLNVSNPSYLTASNNVCVGNNINKFNPNEVAAHLYFSLGASNNTVVGGHGTVIDLGDNNTFKGGYRDLTGIHLTTPGGVGDEISNIKDWWDLP